MAKKTVEELLTTFGEIIGDRTDETVIGFMEDISDSYNPVNLDDYVDRNTYDSLMKRYRDRFYSKDENETETVEKPDEMKDTVTEAENTTYESILKEE